MDNQSKGYTLENFGLNPDTTKAFTLHGIWNQDDPEILDFHGFHQVLMTIDGTILLYDEHFQYPLFKHVAALIPAHLPHRVKKAQSQKDIHCESIFFNRDFFPLSDNSISVFEITDLGGALIRTLNEEPLIDISEGFKFQCVELLGEVIKRDLQDRTQQIRLPVSDDPRIQKATNFIESHYRSKITLTDLAEAVNLSTRQLTRIFIKDFKMSAMEYLRTYRILHTSVSLSSSKKKVIDIALSHGYETISTFYQDFFKYFGTSPDRFRKLSL
ncbi:MAG: helix-turn-helix domain-containing protein [Spirochaetales bacterium]|nr:helix-turn-helix domain-containing protein [Spirochaetales bacterium]